MVIYKIIVSIALLLTPWTIKAVSHEELLKIKRNFSMILIPTDSDPFHLKSILSSIEPEEEVSDQAVVELHQRYPFDREKIVFYISSLSDRGAWPDINYEDKKRSGWEPKIHAERILELVKLYYSRQTSYFRSEEVKKTIHKALDYWFTTKPVCLNWWYNQIGVPKTLGTAFILFEQELTSKEKKAAISVMGNAKFGMTGQNKVWLAGNIMMRALLQNDAELVKIARDTIVSEIVTGKIEGIKDDWSFHQHGAQQQFGNYGLSFVSGMSFFSGVFAGTSLAFDERQLGIISTLIDKGYRWIMWKGKMDVSSLGRQLFHHAPIHKALSLAFSASELGGGESKQCISVACNLLKENYGVMKQNPLVGHKHFWQSDYTIHRRPQWMASVKMASDRVVGVEMMNGDNMKGFYMADGATYIYQDGDEYLDIFPLWDWRKLPGVTAFQSDDPMPIIQKCHPRNATSFVGGVSNGMYGISAMEVNRAGIKACKSWIFIDDYMLCLGAGIQSDSNLVVTTAIEQCHRTGDLSILQDGVWNKVAGQWKSVNAEQRFFHHNTGYIIWNVATSSCVAEVAQRSGYWHDVMQMYRSRMVTGEVSSIYLEHGVFPKNKKYQYLILPDTSPATVKNFNLSSIQILRNDEEAQIVYIDRKKMYCITAYQALSLMLNTGCTLDICTPGIYMLYEENNGYSMWCVEPTQKRNLIKVRFRNREICVPLLEKKGQSINVKL